jgi:hypothetical protein
MDDLSFRQSGSGAASSLAEIWFIGFHQTTVRGAGQGGRTLLSDISHRHLGNSGPASSAVGKVLLLCRDAGVASSYVDSCDDLVSR